MKNPLLTIGISFYNLEDTLVDLARCMFAQTFEDWELILVDDGSSDGGGEIARKIKDPRVRVIGDGVNRGRSVRYNQITQLANGKYIARMDADDMCHPRRFEKQVEFLEEHKDVDVVSCDLLGLGDDNVVLNRSRNPTRHEDICKRAYKSIAMQHGGMVGRVEWFRKFPYPLEYKICVDQALFLSCYRQSRFASIPEPLYFYPFLNTYSLSKHCRSELNVARIIWQYARRYHSPLTIFGAIGGRFLRLGLYAATECAGLRRQLLIRRYEKAGNDDKAFYQEALRTIHSTKVPGLVEWVIENTTFGMVRKTLKFGQSTLGERSNESKGCSVTLDSTK